MQAFIDAVVKNLQETIIAVHPILGIILGTLVVMMESMIPIMPLGVFVTFNVLVFGGLLGYTMSWVGTIIGCYLMFWLVRKYSQDSFREKIKKKKKINAVLKRIDDIDFSELVLITALPFTPAFVINIVAGLSKIDGRKFLYNLLIAKIVMIYFWGYVGTTFVGSVTNIIVLIKLAIMLLLAFVISKYVMKKKKID